MENNDLVTRVVTSLDKHKADNIQVIQVTELTSLGDYFVIANGSSNTQVKSLADYVEYDLSQQGIHPETFRRSLQEFLSDTLSPVCGIDTEVKDNPVRSGSVIRDTEQNEPDNCSVFQIKQERVVRVFYLSIEII